MFKYQLGLKVRSAVTGLEGIIICANKALYGCDRYYIQPRASADGKVPDGYYVDEQDIEVLGPGVTPTPPETPAAQRGGPMARDR